MTFAQRRAAFRAILHGDTCLRPASVFDPLSARLAEDLGFPAMLMAGSTASLAIMGAPDLALITLTEFAEQARRVTRASALPLLVDADHGYGNALNAMRTVAELEWAGVAALTIEDTELPLPYGPVADRLLPLPEARDKMRAAVAGRTDPQLCVIARTSAALTGRDDLADRVRAYSGTGVDAIFLSGLKSAEDLAAAAAATDLPLLVGNVPRVMDDLAALARIGVRLALQGHRTVPVAYAALEAAFKALQAGAHPSTLGDAGLEALITRLSRSGRYSHLDAAFLGRDGTP